MGKADDVVGHGQSAGQSLADQAGRVGDAVSDLPEPVDRRTQGNPLMAGMLAFGAGLLVATLLPETEQEKQLVKHVEPQIAETAEEVQAAAQLTAASAKDTAAEQLPDLREKATEAGQAVKEQAQGAAQFTAADAKDHARQAQQDVRR